MKSKLLGWGPVSRWGMAFFLFLPLVRAQREAPVTPANLPVQVGWSDGLIFSVGSGQFELRLNGRLEVDLGFGEEDRGLAGAGLEFTGWSEFRRARISLSGRVYKRVIYKYSCDFSGSDPKLFSLYMGLKEVPFLGTLKAGYFKELFGLERSSAPNFQPFAERSVADALTLRRNIGMGATNSFAGDRGVWSLGVFRQSDGVEKIYSGSKYNLTGRITGQPWRSEKGEGYLHLGGSVSFRHPAKDDDLAGERDVRFRTGPEANGAPVLVDTGTLGVGGTSLLGDAKGGTRFGGEALLVWGPASLQAEYIHVGVKSSAGDDPGFSGYYLQTSWFVTGEQREYLHGQGVLGRLRPQADFSGDGHWGAWELLLRFSALDLTDSAVQGGEIQDFTCGVNWHLNPSTRIMLNYIHTEVDNGPSYDGAGDLVLLRFHLDF